jgi:hypothetical protein
MNSTDELRVLLVEMPMLETQRLVLRLEKAKERAKQRAMLVL